MKRAELKYGIINLLVLVLIVSPLIALAFSSVLLLLIIALNPLLPNVNYNLSLISVYTFPIVWFIMAARYVSEKIIITDDGILFKNFFGRIYTISFDTVIDWSETKDSFLQSGYSFSAYLIYDKLFPKLISRSLEVWFKDKDGKIKYFKKRVSSFENNKFIFEALNKNVERSERPSLYGWKYYFKENKLLILIVIGLTLIVLIPFSVFAWQDYLKNQDLKVFIGILGIIVLSYSLFMIFGGGIGIRSRSNK